MRIDSVVKNADKPDDNYEQYTWLIFRPEESCFNPDLIMIGRMVAAFDKANVSYVLNYTEANTCLEVKESHFMKFLTKTLWNVR